MQSSELGLLKLSEQLSRLGQNARQLLDSPELNLFHQRQVSANYEKELIEVAASAIAAVVDLRVGHGESEPLVNLEIEQKIRIERMRQDEKFGAMPRRLDPLIWIAVVLEEAAEACEEVKA